MGDRFDPYYRWLAIPPDEQPPNHYRLLGLKLLENDPNVIEAAADRQMTYLQSLQSGPHAAAARQLLDEITAARLVLLREETKARYDEPFRQQAKRVQEPKMRRAAPLKPDAAPVKPELPLIEQTAAPELLPVRIVRTQSPASPHFDRTALIVFGGAAGATAMLMLVGVALVLVVRSLSTGEPIPDGQNPVVPVETHDVPTLAPPSPPPVAAIPRAGLLAHWTFDESQGDRAHDVVGGFDGTIHSATWTDGVRGSALHFDGRDDMVTIGNPPGLNFSGPITLSAWIRPRDGAHKQIPFANILVHGFNRAMTREVFLRLHQLDGRYSLHTGAWKRDNTHIVASLNAADLGRWISVAGTYDGQAWRLFIDGTLVATRFNSYGALTIDADWAIGARAEGQRFFHGDIDEVRIYNRALSNAEVKALARRE